MSICTKRNMPTTVDHKTRKDGQTMKHCYHCCRRQQSGELDEHTTWRDDRQARCDV